jgi:hypothetical protein
MPEIDKGVIPTEYDLKKVTPEEEIGGRHLEQILLECGSDAKTVEKILKAMSQKLKDRKSSMVNRDEASPPLPEVKREDLARFEQLVLENIDQVDYDLIMKKHRRFNPDDTKRAFQELLDSKNIPIKIKEVIIPEDRGIIEFTLEGVDRSFAAATPNSPIGHGRGQVLFESSSYNKVVIKTTRLAQFRPEIPGRDLEVVVKGSVVNR